MRRELVVGVALGLAASLAVAQAGGSGAGVAMIEAEPMTFPVHYGSANLTAPELLPSNLSVMPPKGCKKFSGEMQLEVIVDALGQPRDVTFIRPLGTALDELALQVIASDRFKPGRYGGVPAPVAMSADVKLHVCLERKKDAAGKRVDRLGLMKEPEQRLHVLPQPPYGEERRLGSREPADSGIAHVGLKTGVSAPVTLNNLEAQFTEYARQQKISGTCLITLIVDRQGMPRNLRVIKSLDPGLDQNALASVNAYRFKPAMKNGHPVPVLITVEVSFKLY